MKLLTMQSDAKSEPCEMEGKNIADQKITQKENGEERELQGTD